MLSEETLARRYDALLISDDLERLRRRAQPLLEAERRAIEAQVALASLRTKAANDPSRTRALEKELDELAEPRARLRALRRHETRLMLALERARAKTRADDARRSLPLVREARVAAPCPLAWDELEGDGAIRHCRVCAKDVYDLSAMTPEEADRTLVVRGGIACVRVGNDARTGFVGFVR